MAREKAMRRSCSCERINASRMTDANIVSDFERACHWAGWVLGITFGIVFALMILAG